MAVLDLHLLAMLGAGERSRSQWEALLRRAGRRLDRVRPGPYASWVEAVPGRAPAGQAGDPQV